MHDRARISLRGLCGACCRSPLSTSSQACLSLVVCSRLLGISTTGDCSLPPPAVSDVAARLATILSRDSGLAAAKSTENLTSRERSLRAVQGEHDFYIDDVRHRSACLLKGPDAPLSRWAKDIIFPHAFLYRGFESSCFTPRGDQPWDLYLTHRTSPQAQCVQEVKRFSSRQTEAPTQPPPPHPSELSRSATHYKHPYECIDDGAR